jgi:hypothetical protein
MRPTVFCLIALCCVHSHTTTAQQKILSRLSAHERLSLTANVGLSNYFGDLCNKFDCIKFRPGFGIGVWYRFTNHLSSKTELNYYRLYSNDVYPQRNLDFRSGNVELYTSAVADLFAYNKHFKFRKFISPYIFGGIGVTYFDPHGKDPQDGKWVALRPLKTEGVAYSPFTMILPVGAGIRLRFKKNMEFIVEGGYRKTFTDHLDDVSASRYVNTSTMSPQAARLSMKAVNAGYEQTYLAQPRGNPNSKDDYFIFNIKIRYVIGIAATNLKEKHVM